MAEPSSHQTHRHHQRGLALICAGCTGLLLLAAWFSAVAQDHPALGYYGRLEAAVTDQLQVYGRKAELHPDLVFVPIESASFEQSDLWADEREAPALRLMAEQGFPFPRQTYALILQRLIDAGAKAVMLDILFPSEKVGDQPFRMALEQYASSVVIGSNLQGRAENQGGDGIKIVEPSRSLLEVDSPLYDARVGFVNFKPDPDGRVRRTIYRTTMLEYGSMAPEAEDQELFSLAAQGVRKTRYAKAVPSGHESRMFRYVREPARYPIHTLFVPRIWEAQPFAGGSFFKNKLVLIGPYGNWVKDEVPTPFGPTLGPEVHLSALNALLTGDYLHETGWQGQLLLILAGGGVAFLTSYRVAGPLTRTTGLLAIGGLYVGAAFLLYNGQGLILPLLGPVSALLSSGFIGLVWERVIEQQEKTRVRKTLERYVSKDVVKEVLDNPLSFLNVQGGQRKPVTILFSDVRGFTTLTESADPAQLVTQLNEYFTEMVRIVFAHRGTLDKFIGDAVMAQWGSIVTRGPGADACRAVAAALDMLKILPKLNAGWKQRGWAELQIGLGINHGDAICAHIGSDEKHEFTVIGDAVNLASRLEGATKEFHQDLLIGELVAPLVRECFHLRTVDLLQVKGKTRPVEVFAVAGALEGGAPAPAWLLPYEEGVKQYRSRAFGAAEASFSAVLEQAPEDWLAGEYRRRARAYQETPPPAEWDGVFVMAKK